MSGTASWWFLLSLLLLVAGCPFTLSRSHSPEFGRALAEGDRHTHHGRDQEAAAAFAQAADHADRRVDRDEANYRRAQALHDDGQDTDALVVLDALAAGRPVSRRTVRALFDASKIRSTLRQHTLARSGFLQIVIEYPDSAPATRALRWLLRERAPEETLPLLLEIEPQVTGRMVGDDVLMRLHLLYVDRDEPTNARNMLERIVAEHPYPHGQRWDEAILLLAEMDIAEGHAQDAIARLERMLERAESTDLYGSYTLPGMPKAHLWIARLYRDAGQLALADDWFETLPDAFPASILRDDAAVERGEMWLAAGQRPRGCAIIREALTTFEVGRARRRASRLGC